MPGPGEYDSGRYFNADNKPFTIGERRCVTFEDNPGVGKYEPEQADAVTKSRVPGAKFSNSPRKTSLGKQIDEKTPGVGAYQPKDTLTKYNPPTILLGSSQHHTKTNSAESLPAKDQQERDSVPNRTINLKSLISEKETSPSMEEL